MACAILRDEEQAADLTQEAFVSLVNDEKFDPNRGPLIAYLIAYTRSRAIDRKRAKGRHLRLLETRREAVPKPQATEQPEEQLLAAERKRRMQSAMKSLSQREREVLELAYFQGMSQADIAAHLDQPLGSVKSWARRGLLRLKDLLSEATTQRSSHV